MRFPITLNSVFANSVFGPAASVLQSTLKSGRSLLLLLVLTLGLTGCLDAQTQITFDSPQSGQIVQRIELGSQLAAAQGWLNQLETQARKVGAKVQRPTRQSLAIVLPFTNAQDLETKFNQLVTPPAGKASSQSDFPAIVAQLQVRTSNLLLLQRNRLIYDIDLTPLGVQGDDGNLLFNAGDSLDLNFGVAGPWGSGGRAGQTSGGQTQWHLQPGQPNHIEATLWMPSPLGLGAAAIVGLVIGGTAYQRQRQ
jgi:Protein of unknown function (DUF3153)